MVAAVVFDVGETLLDDSRECGAWADWIGVPRHTFSALLGAVTALGEDNARAFDYLRPGFDVVRERRLRELAGRGEQRTATCIPMCGPRWGAAWAGTMGRDRG